MSDLKQPTLNAQVANAIGTAPLSGPVLLDMVQQIVTQASLLGASSNSVSFDFMSDPAQLKAGDWVATLNIHVTKFPGHIVMEQGDLAE